MNYRIADILAGESQNTAGTKTIDLTIQDILSRITIRFKGTNNGDAPTAHPAKMISKVEVVDGSDVLMSMSGMEIQALDHYNKLTNRQDTLNFSDNEMAIIELNLNFGRHLWDPDLALDLKQFNNPQLKITHNKASGGSAPDAGNLRVIGWAFDEKVPAPSGYLMAKEYYSYTCGADGTYEYIDLPTDYPLKMMLSMALLADYHPWQVVNEIKIDEENDKRVIMDKKISDWSCYTSQMYQAVTEMMRFTGAASTALTCFITPAYECTVAPVSRSTAGHFAIGLPYGGNVDITPEQAGDDFALVFGYLPHGAIPVPFGDPKDINDWYNVAEKGNIRLRQKAGSAGASGSSQIVLQQYRNY